MLFKSKTKDKVNCYAYHFFAEKKDTKELTLFLYNYFDQKYSIRPESFYSFDLKYKDYDGQFEAIVSKTSNQKWEDLEAVYLHTEIEFDSIKTLLIHYASKKPVSIVIAIDERFSFDMKEFGKILYDQKSLFYAYKYVCTSFKSCISYSGGGIEGIKHISGMPRKRLKQNVIWRWRESWEKIRDGFLRDIYSENIITKQQLTNLIGDVPFQESVKINKWGSIEKISTDLFYWKIEDTQLADVQQQLYKLDIFV